MPSSFTWRHYLLKKVCIVLGVYEFISAYIFYYNPKYSLHHIPTEFKYPTGTHPPVTPILLNSYSFILTGTHPPVTPIWLNSYSFILTGTHSPVTPILPNSYSLNVVLFNLVRCIFAVYLLTLGLQRLSYGFSKDNNIMLVFTLLLTHIVEGFLWWSMALTKSSLTPVVLLLDAIQLKLGVDTFIVLIGVPLLVTLIMYLSIDTFIKKKNI